jgi:hypothetical protein
MKTIRVEAGKATKIIGKFSNSIAATYEFTATCELSNHTPTGTIDIRGSNWIFPKASTIQPLQVENTVSKSMWDTFFSVYVSSDHDVIITMKNQQVDKLWMIIAIAIVVMVAAASVMFVGSQ